MSQRKPGGTRGGPVGKSKKESHSAPGGELGGARRSWKEPEGAMSQDEQGKARSQYEPGRAMRSQERDYCSIRTRMMLFDLNTAPRPPRRNRGCGFKKLMCRPGQLRSL